MAAFLTINEYQFDPPRNELANEFISLAAGGIEWGDFRAWVLRYCKEKLLTALPLSYLM
jgi:hypothetical protein